jgi:CRISPR-associated protein Cmr1
MKFKIISPVFSYGADNGNDAEPEIRPTAIKGMMRYMFRIAHPTLETKGLLEKENAIFGDAKENASPIRLAVVSRKVEIKKDKFLFHDKKNRQPTKKYMTPNSTFTLRTGLRSKFQPSMDIHWYENLLELSFLLIGIGGRSRKGRGRAQISEKQLTINEMKEKILKNLNVISESIKYEFQNGEIVPNNSKRFTASSKRPRIQKIIFGKVLAVPKEVSKEVNQRNKTNRYYNLSDLGSLKKSLEKKEETELWKKYLKKVDQASHDMKEDEMLKSKGDDDVLYYATGSIKPRFASSIIVGVAETTAGLMPIYTCVRPVVEGHVLDAEDEWNELIKKIEGRGQL